MLLQWNKHEQRRALDMFRPACRLDAKLMTIISLRYLAVEQAVLELFDKFQFDKAHNF
jgi:hypothetical protein